MKRSNQPNCGPQHNANELTQTTVQTSKYNCSITSKQKKNPNHICKNKIKLKNLFANIAQRLHRVYAELHNSARKSTEAMSASKLTANCNNHSVNQAVKKWLGS
ncbi:unnamed protein product [Ceratitis capitata]|uniref:(Mediterranean fruit fly) hypothetical protein n=1 Tax=Ceratitis capitata TaxID=7213 RepID=A0A811U1D5_CERCA|nr:unnamed protein product [Ceratitis capitata]